MQTCCVDKSNSSARRSNVMPSSKRRLTILRSRSLNIHSSIRRSHADLGRKNRSIFDNHITPVFLYRQQAGQTPDMQTLLLKFASVSTASPLSIPPLRKPRTGWMSLLLNISAKDHLLQDNARVPKRGNNLFCLVHRDIPFVTGCTFESIVTYI